MELYDVVVVGGGPAGFNAVKTIRSVYPEKRVLLINDREDLQIPCSIPYVVSGRIPVEKNRYPLEKVRDLGAELKIDRVVSINPNSSQLFLESGKIVSYERLILSTGWIPRRLSLGEENLEGVFYIDTSTEGVSRIKEEVEKAERIVIIGGGFISIGFADLISRELGKSITVVEASKRIASGVFSSEITSEMESKLGSQGVEILKSERVSALEGDGRVKRVVTSDGEIDTDLVLIFVGFLPNTKLAVDCGIETERGFIRTDSYLRTSVDNVLSAGNCTFHRSAIDGEFTPGMVASVSARDGRIAGLNVLGPRVEDRGIVPAGITEVGGTFYGFSGYTEEILNRKGFVFKRVSVESTDGYPSAIGAVRLKLNLYFLESGRLVGGEVVGSSKIVSSLVDLISKLIEGCESAERIASMNSVAFPPVTPPPLLQPLQEGALKFLTP
jgi:NADPH-dependent 2,4-dienoyl-CoA reductase/sulfur reductase-like enzyme